MPKITDIADELSMGEEAFEKLKAEVQKVKEYYQALRKIALPDSLDKVTDDKEPLTEKLSPKLNKKIFLKWNTRASKIEKVNEALANFEIGIVEELTVSNSSVIFHEIHKLFRKLEWVLSHIGELTLLIAGTLGYVSGRWGQDIWDATRDAVTTGLDAMREGEYDAFQKKAGILADKLAEAARFLIKSATLGVVAKLMQSTVSGFSSKYYFGMIDPIKQLKAITETKLQSDAFPQGSGRWRRRKAHRSQH